MIASSIENLAIEFRHLHRSEAREVEEFFPETQKGSSAMPHKKIQFLMKTLLELQESLGQVVFLSWRTFHSGMKEISLTRQLRGHSDLIQ